MGPAVAVDFSATARDDLLDILGWYSTQGVPEVGERLVAEVVERVGRLALFPDSGHVVPEFQLAWLRELEMPPFRIVYRRAESSVAVVRVWRSERLMDPGLSENG